MSVDDDDDETMYMTPATAPALGATDGPPQEGATNAATAPALPAGNVVDISAGLRARARREQRRDVLALVLLLVAIALLGRE